MKDLVKKVAVGLSTGALMANMVAASAFAGTITVVQQGNGADSENSTSVTSENATVVEQSNHTSVSNNIDADSSTGGNRASRNTTGDVSIETGDAESTVAVTNEAGMNNASVGCGGCAADVEAVISGNGADSENDIDLEMNSEKFVTQTNDTHFWNDVDVNAKTGHNDADYNTNGDVEIMTGSAEAIAIVDNKAGLNAAHVGGNDGEGQLDLWISGNGADSDSDIDVALDSAVVLEQDNWTSIWNDVDVDAYTGKNDADRNTGGSVSVETGDAFAGAAIDNMAGFNWANVSDCCEFDGLVKVAGNGADSENDVELDLSSFLGEYQDNWFWGDNDVDANAKTGYNDVDENTGSVYGDPSVMTGDAETQVEAITTGGTNMFSTGDAMGEVPEFEWNFNMGSSSNWFAWLMGGWMQHSS